MKWKIEISLFVDDGKPIKVKGTKRKSDSKMQTFPREFNLPFNGADYLRSFDEA